MPRTLNTWRQQSARVVLPALLGVLGAGLCFPADAARAVTGGGDDGLAHPYVVSVLPPGASGPRCSGVLINTAAGPVLLTAAHCLYHAGSRTGTGVRVNFEPRFTVAGSTAPAAFYIDPLYDPTRSPDHDLAVVVLAGPAAAPPASLAAVGASSGYRGSLLTVGTGAPYPGVRRAATETVTGRSGPWLTLSPGNGNSCAGDSGGPDLLPGSDEVVALTDQGTCTRDTDQRVDTVEAHQFVEAAAQWPHHRPLIRTRMGERMTIPGARLVLHVAVSPLYTGETALREVLVGGQWTVVQSTVIGLDGGAVFSFTVGHRLAVQTRVRLLATATHPGSLSRGSRIRVH